MKRFEVQLQGKNYLLNIDGELKKFGFYVTKFVKANNSEEAVKKAKILIHQDAYLKSSVINEGGHRPSINLVKIYEIGFFKFFINKSATGFTFYVEDE